MLGLLEEKYEYYERLLSLQFMATINSNHRATKGKLREEYIYISFRCNTKHQTKPTNDGGIDDIINRNPLGTSTVYIRAKRYTENNKVGRSAIQSFYGALATVHAD